MNSCHNKPIRGQSCSANQRAQLSGQMYSEFVYFKSVKRVCCWPNPRYCKVCFNPIYLFTERVQSISSFSNYIELGRNQTLKLFYKQEEQFSLTVKCNNWLPIFVLWPRHYCVFLVIVLTFYQIIRGKIKPSLDRGNFQVFNKIISCARRILFFPHHLICFDFSLKITHVMLLSVPASGGASEVMYAFLKMLILCKIDGHPSKCIVFILNFQRQFTLLLNIKHVTRMGASFTPSLEGERHR